MNRRTARLDRQQRVSHTSNQRSGNRAGKRLPALPVTIFLVSVIIPFVITLGSLRLSANRIALAAMLIPCLILWLSGRAGPKRLTDFALALMCGWMTVGYFVLHGSSIAIEAGGIAVIETMGAYLLGRCYIRDADSFYRMSQLLFWIIAAMLPFALYESVTGNNILLSAANSAWPSGGDVPKDPRWGFDRVQGVFQHPILFGVYCGSGLALTYYVVGYNTSAIKRALKTAIVGITAISSLSSGPLTGLAAQAMLISWDKALNFITYRWKLLIGLVASFIVSIEIVANRSTPEIFISYFAFNTSTAYNRLRIWRYGIASVYEHPLFGVGFGEWERPWYMSPSMDMFWLVPAVRNGAPTALLFLLAFFYLLICVARKKDIGYQASQFRLGYVICMIGLFLMGWTVNYWKANYVMFMFLLGSGAWILDAKTDSKTSGTEDDRRAARRHGFRRDSRYRYNKARRE